VSLLCAAGFYLLSRWWLFPVMIVIGFLLLLFSCFLFKSAVAVFEVAFFLLVFPARR
jgi:hypothetical protein